MQPAVDQSEDLAETLGMSLQEFVEAFGAGWTQNPAKPWHDYDSDPSGGMGLESTPWHVAGDPVQLMLRVFHHGVFIAMPGAVGRDVGKVEYQPRSQAYVRFDEIDEKLPAIMKRMLAARRRSFRYCRYCREITPPESLIGDTCHGCATAWLGIVF